MKRRMLDIGWAALAAALFLTALQSGWLYAAFITYPKSWTVGEILTSGDLNAQFAAITAQVNGNLDDTNLSGAANINGAKLADAPAGITTTKLNDLSVTADKLAVSAAVHSITGIAVTPNVTTTGAETTIVTYPAITARGGHVLLTGMIGYYAVVPSGMTATIRFKRDGSLILQADYPLAAAGLMQVPLPTPSFIDTPTAGSHVYTVTVQVSTGAGSITTVNSNQGIMFAMELS